MEKRDLLDDEVSMGAEERIALLFNAKEYWLGRAIASEARVRELEEALREIAEPCNVYGEDAKEMRDTARRALEGGTPDE